MWLIQYAIFGLVAGALARMLHPGRDPMNWVWTMFLGIAGAVVGGWIGTQMGVNTNGGLASWAAAVGGSVLLLFVHHLMTSRSAGPVTTTTNESYKDAVFKDLSQGPGR